MRNDDQSIFYSISELKTPGLYEIHSTGDPIKFFGYILVSDTGKLYDYETKHPYSQMDIINIGNWEENSYQQCFYKKVN